MTEISEPSGLSRNRPRVLQCVTHLALGGAERIALTISKELREEFDFHFYAVRGLADGHLGQSLAQELESLRIPLHRGPRVPMRFGGVITSAIDMARVVMRTKPQIIHLHTEIPEAAYSGMVTLLPTKRCVPIVRTIHNAVFWEHWRKLGRWGDRRMQHALVGAVSNDAKAAFYQLRSESGAPSAEDRTTTIYNGVCPPEITRKDFTGDDTRPVRIVFGGRLEAEKGVDLLPQVLAGIRPPRQGIELTIFGSGRYEPMMRALAASPPSGWQIKLFPPQPDFARTLHAYDLMLVPSRGEGLGLVAIEAFLAGIPVVATDAVGLREALPTGYTWTAKAGDATSFAAQLQDALDRPQAWAEQVGAAAAFARERFSPRKMADAYRLLYQKALTP